MTQEEIESHFTHVISCNPTQSTYSGQNPDYLDKSATYLATPGTAGTNHDVATCTLTLQWNEATNVQTPGQDQTYTQGAVTLNYNAQWTYVQK